MPSASPNTQFFSFDQGAAGTTALVAGVAGRRIVLKSLVLVMSAAGTAKLQSAAVDRTGAMALATNGGLVLPPSESEAWVECATGATLNLVTVTGAAKGCGTYTLDY